MSNLLSAVSACVAMFSANDASLEDSLWLSDGRPGTTVKMNGPGPAFITPMPNGAVFSARNSQRGRELFFSRGTLAASGLLKDINPGTASSSPSSIGVPTELERRFARIGNLALFGATSAAKGRELYRSNGTNAGTVLVKEFMPGTSNGLREVLASTDNYALLVAQDLIHGNSMWATNGTAGGTRFLMTERGNNGAQGIISTRLNANQIVFTQDRGRELWVTNGTRSGTRRIRQFFQCAGGSSFNHIKNLQGFPDRGFALFSGCTLAQGHELWRTDGTTAGTFMVRAINIGPQHSTPSGFYKFNRNQIVFSATSDQHGRELWTTQGTKETTRLIKDIWPGTRSSEPRWFRRFGNKLIFAAQINGFGADRLFVSNLTASGTQQLGDVVVRSPFANIGTKLVFGGSFVSSSGIGTELLSTTGTVNSTQLVKDIYPGFGSSKPFGLTAVKVNQSGFVTPAECPEQ